MVSELEVNARFQALQNQRDNALNAVVLLNGELAVARTELEATKRLLELAEVKKAANDNPVEVPAA